MSQKLAFTLPLLFAFVSFAFAQSNGIMVLERRDEEGSSTDRAAASGTVASVRPTATAEADELVESANITLDGQIFPPSIQVEGVSSTE